MPAPPCATRSPIAFNETLKQRNRLKVIDFPAQIQKLNARPDAANRAAGIAATIQKALASAGLDTHSGAFKGTADTINAALARAGLTTQGDAAEGQQVRGRTFDGVAREIDRGAEAPESTVVGDPTKARQQGQTGFVSRSFSNHAGTRDYKLYVPSSAEACSEPAPLIVMLHGCTQNADDFALGTQMNALADQHGFLVAYPEQPANANGSRCWNWFRTADQSRDRGEPALIAGITREIIATQRIDEGRIFIAGLSAGAAMALIVADAYPELYAGVGAHSGLPPGSARDLPSALAAMKGGGAQVGAAGSHASTCPPRSAGVGVPTIVFHGDKDQTVHPRNGKTIIEHAIAGREDRAQLRVEMADEAEAHGRYARTIYRDATGQGVAEEWAIRGGGHAWSGGSPLGSFTDGRGPDASAAMIRFFLSQPRSSGISSSRS